MTDRVRIIQITDCHLHGDPRLAYRGVNPYDSLNALLQKVHAINPDLLLASGDLSEDASTASYEALQQLFNPLAIQVLALPGNHDDDTLLAQAFPGSPVDSVQVSEHGPWQIIRLNSSMQGKPEGRLNGDLITGLEQVLKYQSKQPRVIALHHQPIAIGSPWIDKYRLLQPERFLQLVDQCPGVKAVVWGHVHEAFDAQRNGTAMLGGPSSVINSIPGVQKFTADPSGPACRWLELKPDGSVETGIIRARVTTTTI